MDYYESAHVPPSKQGPFVKGNKGSKNNKRGKKIRIKVTPNVGAYGGTREARRHTRPPAQCDTLQNAVRNAARRTSVISKKTRVEILCLYQYLLPMR